MANFIQHEACDECGSSDALARYDDNSTHCFACKHTTKGDGERVERTYEDDTGSDWTPIDGHYQALPAIGLDEETCRKWHYQVGHLEDGTPCHIMESRDDSGKLIGQKFRTPETKGKWRGNAKNPPLYGKWLWPAGGKYLTITEGEKDALSLSKAFGHKYPVVSLPNGTGSVRQVIKRDYDYIDSFETAVLMFDMDEPGRAAVEEAVSLLPPGKVKIAKLPLKDANDVLREIGAGELVKAFWSAETYRPDGIVEGAAFTLDRLKTKSKPGYSLRYPKLNSMLMGLRKGELTLLTAGSGIGKSTLAREVAYGLRVDHGCTIGNIFLEESNDVTAQAYAALHTNTPLWKIMHDPSCLTDDAYSATLRDVIHGGMWFYDHFGSLESDRLLSKMRYLAQVAKADFLVLDHFSIATSGMESSSEGERKDIDILMTRSRQLIAETGVGIVGIVHLKRKPGTSYNEGGQVSLNDFRGSAAFEQLADNAIALERDQQAEDDNKKNTSTARVLKCRVTGRTGVADAMRYNETTGRLEVASPFEAASPFDPHKEDTCEIF